MERKEFKLNDVIFTDGVYQKWMYSICEGSVDIYSGYGTSEEKKLITLTKGQTFGEIGMIAVMSRTATAVASDETVVLEQISNEEFVDYLRKNPENLQPIMTSVSKRIRELTEDMAGITQMTNALLATKNFEEKPAGWLAENINRLFGSLKAKKEYSKEFAVMYKRKQALNGEISPVVRYAAGDVLFRAGDQADCMYDIYEGSVGIYSDYQTESEKLLTKLHEEDVFGEMGVLDNMPRSATAVCLSDCSICVVKAENFMEFFQNKPMKILQILEQMCVRLRDLTETYLQACKTLEELPLMEENNHEAMAKLEQNLQMQLSASMYDISFSRDAWRNAF